MAPRPGLSAVAAREVQGVLRDRTKGDHPELRAVGEGDGASLLLLRNRELQAVDELVGKQRARGDVPLGEPKLVLVAGATAEALIGGLPSEHLNQPAEGRSGVRLDSLTDLIRRQEAATEADEGLEGVEVVAVEGRGRGGGGRHVRGPFRLSRFVSRSDELNLP